MSKDYIVVSAISQFKIKYVMHKDDLRGMNVDISNPTEQQLIEWAEDTVTMQECEEFSQEHVGEFIVETRDITEQEMLELFKKNNAYLKSWSPEFVLEWIRKQLK